MLGMFLVTVTDLRRLDRSAVGGNERSRASGEGRQQRHDDAAGK